MAELKDKNIEEIKGLILRMQELNGKIKNDPLLFYGEEGKELIMASKELHVLGSMLMRSGRAEMLKQIPLER